MKNFYRFLMTVIAGLTMMFMVVAPASAIPSAPTADVAVVDETGTLTDTDIQTISATIDNANVDNRAQIAVYMTNEIPDGQDVETASLEVAREWGIGSADDKNGVLLYIAKDDGELRIEVADASSEFLTDSEANRIVQNEIIPGFKNGDFAGGINDGVSKVRAEVNGEIGAPREPIDMSGFWNFLMTSGIVVAIVAFLGGIVIFIRKIVLKAKAKATLNQKNAVLVVTLQEKIAEKDTRINELSNMNSRLNSNVSGFKKEIKSQIKKINAVESRLGIAENDPKRFAKILEDEREAERQRLAEEKRKREEAARIAEKRRIEAERKAEEERRYWASPEGKAEKKRIADEKRREEEARRERERKAEEERRRKAKERREREEEERRERNRRNAAIASSYSSSSSSSSSSFGFGGGGGFSGGGASGKW